MRPERPATGLTAISAALAAAFGLGIGWIDLRTTEVTSTVVALLVAGFVLGVLHPRWAWRWAVLLAVGLPAMAAVALLLHLRTAEPVSLDPRIFLVVLAFALAGCYGGVALRRTLSRRTPPNP